MTHETTDLWIHIARYLPIIMGFYVCYSHICHICDQLRQILLDIFIWRVILIRRQYEVSMEVEVYRCRLFICVVQKEAKYIFRI